MESSGKTSKRTRSSFKNSNCTEEVISWAIEYYAVNLTIFIAWMLSLTVLMVVFFTWMRSNVKREQQENMKMRLLQQQIQQNKQCTQVMIETLGDDVPRVHSVNHSMQTSRQSSNSRRSSPQMSSPSMAAIRKANEMSLMEMSRTPMMTNRSDTIKADIHM